MKDLKLGLGLCLAFLMALLVPTSDTNAQQHSVSISVEVRYNNEAVTNPNAVSWEITVDNNLNKLAAPRYYYGRWYGTYPATAAGPHTVQIRAFYLHGNDEKSYQEVEVYSGKQANASLLLH